MKIFGRLKKYIAALLVMTVLITSSFSVEAHADPLTGVAISGILKMLESIFYSVAVGRSGLRSNESSDDLIDAIHDAEDTVAGLAGTVLTLDPALITWNLSNAVYNRVSYAFSQHAFNDYVVSKGKTASEADENDLQGYLTDTGMGTYNNGTVNIAAEKVNGFATWIHDHRSDISGASVVDPSAEYPNYPDLYFDVNGITYTTSITRVLADLGVSEANTFAQVFDYSQFVIPDNIRSLLDNFTEFDLATEPFIISVAGNKCILFHLNDHSIILRSESGNIVDIINSDDFLFKYNNFFYGANYIYNSFLGYANSSISYNTIVKGAGYYEHAVFYNRCFDMYVLPIDNASRFSWDYRGWPAYDNPVNYYTYDKNDAFPLKFGVPIGYLSTTTNYLINPGLLQDLLVLNVDNSYVIPGTRENYSFTDTYLLDRLMNLINLIKSFSLIKNIPISTTTSLGIVSEEDEEGSGAYQPPWVILDNGNDIPVDTSKYTEVNDIFENASSSDAMAEAYNTSLHGVVEGLEDLAYKTSTIYKLLFSWHSGITAIPTILSSILTGVNGLVTGIGQQIGQWVIDGETGDNYLSHLVPIDDIAAGVADIPGYFIDEDMDEPFLGQTVTAVNTVIDNLGVEEGSESIAELLGRIATGIDALAGDEAAAEDEETEGAPAATIASAIDLAVTNNGGRPTNDVSKIMMLPLMFIFILLMILFLLLKALAFVVMIFRTPASTAFLNSGMITGLNWLKTTYITSSGGSLDMTNGTASNTITGLFGQISLWGILIFCVDLVAIFAIVKVAKKWADRQHGD